MRLCEDKNIEMSERTAPQVQVKSDFKLSASQPSSRGLRIKSIKKVNNKIKI